MWRKTEQGLRVMLEESPMMKAVGEPQRKEEGTPLLPAKRAEARRISEKEAIGSLMKKEMIDGRRDGESAR